MGWYRREKLALAHIGRLASRVVERNKLIFQHSSRICRSGYLDSGSKGVRFNRFSSFCSISQRLGTRGIVGINGNLHNPFLLRAKRFYCVDRDNVHHSRPTWPRRGFPNRQKFHNLMQFLQNLILVKGNNPFFLRAENLINGFIVLMVGSGVLIYGKFETVPYTERTHFILLSKDMDRSFAESLFEGNKAAFEEKILPPEHPESVRVRMIAQNIIDALQRRLRKEQVWSDLGYASEYAILAEGHGRETLSWDKEDEILDDKLVRQSRKIDQERGSQADTSHLDRLNWEILVVNEPVVHAECLPGGKIVVFTGLFEHFKSDVEIATIIGHEVGHVVARHFAEEMTKKLGFAILPLILLVKPEIVSITKFWFLMLMSFFFLNQPWLTRRMEIEADHIGLQLIASAGYDPRGAPKVYQKLGEIAGDSTTYWDYFFTYSSRAELLAQDKIMEEALTMYRDVKARWSSEIF